MNEWIFVKNTRTVQGINRFKAQKGHKGKVKPNYGMCPTN